ncbi:hypothetical protein [Pseudomonas sichuanensis]|uniref:Uncharacterized protein n=1 Tax=Pseudomonas sichuanensis TaxID=2213015 RepID=A0ABV0DCT6_9PSED
MRKSADESPKSDFRAIVFTLLGVVITAAISWFSAYQAASVNSRQSCLARLDAREVLVRSKAENFFVAQGNLIALASHRMRTDQDYEQRLDAVVEAAYSLSPYLDRKTYEPPKLIAQRLLEKFYPNKSVSDKKNDDQNNKALLDLMNKWIDEYNALMEGFESAKDRC